MQGSPIKIIELCVYILIIIFAIIWLIAGGRFYKPPIQPVINVPMATPSEPPAPPPAVLPRGEFFPK